VSTVVLCPWSVVFAFCLLELFGIGGQCFSVSEQVLFLFWCTVFSYWSQFLCLGPVLPLFCSLSYFVMEVMFFDLYKVCLVWG